MKIVVTGASGFVGTHLARKLLAGGHTLHAIGRNWPGAAMGFTQWNATREPAPAAAIEGADAIIHLAGEPVAQRWNARVKQRIADSRVIGTRNLIAAVAASSQRPAILISASAVGYYGDTSETAVTEAAEPGSDFLAETCVAWENEAARGEALGLRVVRLRLGIVLGRDGGALKQMLRPFRLGVGGPLSSGTQWMSWIHIEDLVEAIGFLLVHPVPGAVNATSPHAVRNAEFTRELATVLHRPAVFRVPRLALRLILGEAAEAVVASQRVLPSVLLRSGFAFRFAYLRPALESLLP